MEWFSTSISLTLLFYSRSCVCNNGTGSLASSNQTVVGSSLNQTIVTSSQAEELSTDLAEWVNSSKEIEDVAKHDPALGFKLLRKKHDKLKSKLQDKETAYDLMEKTCITHIIGVTLKDFERHYWKDGHYKMDENCADPRNYSDYRIQDQFTSCEAFFNFKRASIFQGGEKLRNDTLSYLNASGLTVHSFCYKIWKIDQIRLALVHVLEFVDEMLQEYDVSTSRMKAPPFTRGNLTLVEGDENILNALIKLVHVNRAEFRLEKDLKHGGFLLETDEC